MNKVQYIQLLALRGITELEKGQSIADAVRKSGGDPTQAEMVIVNENAMKYYILKLTEEKLITNNLEKEVSRLLTENLKLEKDSIWLSCLEGAGVDNWDGYSYAQEMLDEINNENEE